MQSMAKLWFRLVRAAPKLLADRRGLAAVEFAFILPVMIDATDAATALVPDKFKTLHFTPLPGGEVPREFAERLAGFIRARPQ